MIVQSPEVALFVGPFVLLAALALDAVVGDPDWLWRRLPHPVAWMGRAIGGVERWLNVPSYAFAVRRALGIAGLAVLLAFAIGLGFALQVWTRSSPLGFVCEIVVTAVLLAQNSLYVHVARVRDGFEAGGLTAARQAVSMIVGRDPDALDEAAVSRAAIETLAENFSDGVVAPAFWFLVGGLPGLFAYKLVNTADSMIGHRSERYLAFGWGAARLDDVMNLIPARLAGVLIAVGAATKLRQPPAALRALSAMWRDASRHRSPNAGWPEAAMAGALGIALAGPRRYGGSLVDDHWMNAGGRQDAQPDDIGRALSVYAGACVGHALLVFVVGCTMVATSLGG